MSFRATSRSQVWVQLKAKHSESLDDAGFPTSSLTGESQFRHFLSTGAADGYPEIASLNDEQFLALEGLVNDWSLELEGASNQTP